MIFLTGPPHFQYQNEKTCSANEEHFYTETFVKTSPGWLQLVFHFGTENREEQLKKAPCIFKHTHHIMHIHTNKISPKTKNLEEQYFFLARSLVIST